MSRIAMMASYARPYAHKKDKRDGIRSAQVHIVQHLGKLMGSGLSVKGRLVWLGRTARKTSDQSIVR